MLRRSTTFTRTVRWLVEPRERDGLHAFIARRLWDGYAAYCAPPAPRRRGDDVDATGLDERAADDGRYTTHFFLDHLMHSVMPFWERHAIDHSHGGFITYLDRRGGALSTRKVAAMQGRMIYAFSTAYALTGQPEHLAAARQGVDFLIAHMWDANVGGWIMATSRDGAPVETRKRMFDQSYSLTGLLAYARVTKDARVASFVDRSLAVLEQYAWDDRRGGYFNVFTPEWEVSWPAKTACDQLHMLAVTMAAYEATGDDTYLRRQHAIATYVLDRMVDGRHGLMCERFDADWKYRPLVKRDQVEVGHTLKSSWLLFRMEAQDYSAAALNLLEAALRYGLDTEHGGILSWVYRNGRRASNEKEFWTQCCGLLALDAAHRATGDPRYRRHFVALADWIFAHFPDREYGDWFTSCHAGGQPYNDTKGGDRKAAYYVVQTCAELHRTHATGTGGFR